MEGLLDIYRNRRGVYIPERTDVVKDHGPQSYANHPGELAGKGISIGRINSPGPGQIVQWRAGLIKDPLAPDIIQGAFVNGFQYGEEEMVITA